MSHRPSADIDPGAVNALLEESRDLHRDAMVVTGQALDDLVDLDHDRRDTPDVGEDPTRSSPVRRGLTFGGGVLAAAGVVAALEGLTATPAFAASSPDVRMLQTAASIEVLAVATYKTALTSPSSGEAPPTPSSRRSP